MEVVRDLARKLSAFNEFADFIIVETQFRRGFFAPTAQILKSNSKAAFLQVNSPDAQLFVKMIRPRTEIEIKIPAPQFQSEKCWRIFTAQEISEFVAAVGDKNKIHPPIVPALLILEKICAEFSECRALKLRFKNFIAAGEPLTVKREENHFEILCAGKIKILGDPL